MPEQLPKRIGFYSATSIVIGSIIGAGVFMKPSSMAAELGSPIWLALVWVIAGVFSLFGALIFAELGALMPLTGGVYVYFRKMFGDFIAFLYGWAAFSVINTAAVAAMSFVCAEYASHLINVPQFNTETINSITFNVPFIGRILPLENFGVKIIAILIVISLTALNYRSVNAGNRFQVLATAIKIFVMAALVFGIFFSGNGEFANFYTAENTKSGTALISSIVIAMTGAFFAYDGWINATFIAGEIKDPKKNVPRSLFTGVMTCIIIYVLINQAYLYVMPVEEIASSSLVASDAINKAWGRQGGNLIAALIVICTFGAINGNIMATSRVTYAMGKDRSFLPWAGKEHKKFVTPGNALWLHGIWTCLFIITGSFNMLADMFVFITWVAYLAGAVGLMMLRRKMKGMTAEYKVWGYPIVPVLFILFSAFYLTVTIVNDVQNYRAGTQPVVNSLLGLIITLSGVPIYFLYKKRALGHSDSRETRSESK